MKTSMDDADMGFWGYGYDARGRLLTQADARGCTISLGYDLLGRVLSKSYTGSCGATTSPVSYAYDGVSYREAFGGPGLPAGWSGVGSVSVSGGVLQVVGNGSWTNYAYRPGTGSAGTNAAIPHAAQTAGANAYTYDCNGNMLSRPGQALTFDGENRLVEVNRTLKPTRTEASFTYDGDGTRVKSVVGTTTTVFIGEYLEWTGSTSTMKLHYYAGGRRIAMRSAGTLLWLTGDHLGSSTVTADACGGSATTQLYKAWGKTLL